MATVTFNVTRVTSAEVAGSRTAHELGFESPRRSIHIKIRFKPGASHSSWTSPKSSIGDAAQLAKLLIRGYKTTTGKGRDRSTRKSTRVPGRPVFTNYRTYYEDDMIEICKNVFKTYSHWSVKDRAVIAGERIKKDMQKKMYSGSLGLAANQGKYAARKASAGYGDAPFVATKALAGALEVIIV